MNLTPKGLFSLNAKLAVSSAYFSIEISEVSPDRGTISKPQPQTEEYNNKSLTVTDLNEKLFASASSSRTLIITPLNPTGDMSLSENGDFSKAVILEMLDKNPPPAPRSLPSKELMKSTTLLSLLGNGARDQSDPN